MTMKLLLSLTFCVLVASFIQVNGKGLSLLEDPMAKIDCRATRMVLNQQIKEVKCMPRKTLVKLEPKTGYIYPTDLVLVDRCDGLCFSLSCIPMSTVLKPIVIRKHHITFRTQECAIEFVEEHTKCRCGCNIREEDCNKRNQKYDPDNCMCRCINYREEEECQKREGMRWNPETCKCTCDKPEEECSTGLQWVPAYCRCCKVMMMNNNEN